MFLIFTLLRETPKTIRCYYEQAHIAYMVLFSASYALFHGLRLAVYELLGRDHCPVYGFLSVANPLLAMWLVGLLLAVCLFYEIGVGLSKLKIMVVGDAHLALKPTI